MIVLLMGSPHHTCTPPAKHTIIMSWKDCEQRIPPETAQRYALLSQAVQYAKRYVLENGPLVMEADTYRYHGHSMSDPGSTYRTRDEISSMRQLRDPVEHVRKLLTENSLIESGELKKLEKVCAHACTLLCIVIECHVPYHVSEM